jgi:hypothetical protein
MQTHTFNPSISDEVLQEKSPLLQKTIGGDVPESLIEIWRKHDGFNVFDEDPELSDEVYFYSISECIKENKFTSASTPGYIIIAEEVGTAKVFMMKLGGDSEEILIGEKSFLRIMKPDYIEGTGFSLPEWYRLGCCPDFGNCSVSARWGKVTVRLEKKPCNGLKGLLAIKKILGLNDWPLQEFISFTSSIPCDLMTLQYSKACSLALKINQNEKCVSLRKFTEPDREMPMGASQ